MTDIADIFNKPQEKKPEDKKPEEKPKEEEKTIKSVSIEKEKETETKITKEELTKKPEPEKPVEEEKPEPIPVKPKANGEFDYSPAKDSTQTVIMIYGEKGETKTSTAFSFPGTISCLSFDRKSQPIKVNMKEDGNRITVFDAVRYYSTETPDIMLSSSEISWKYINGLLNNAVQDSDWIVVDAGEVFHKIAEMVMRSRNNLAPFQGVSNRNVWKERRMYIDQLLRMCQNKAKKGVIWTAYVDKNEIVKDGDFVIKEDVPRWIDAVLYETDIVIRVRKTMDKNGQRFTAHVDSSKDPLFKTGKTVDITDKNAYTVLTGGAQ